MAYVLIPAAIAAIVALVVILTGLASKCPACGKWWGMKEVGRREIGREPGMKLVKRTETIRDAQGHTSQVEREVQVRVMRFRFDGSFRCKACAHTVNKEFVEEKGTW